jgi:hypothetical protein
MSKHTPGPWRLLDCSTVSKDDEGKSGKTAFWICCNGSSPLALLKYSKVRDVKADARLIASAPTMLKVLQEIHAHGYTNMKDYNMVRDVISQATGEPA